MAYELRPKSAGDDLASSKNPIRTNFQIIQTDFAVNHVAFDATGEGKHKFLQMPEQASAPTTAADEGGVYTKSATGTNLFFRGESDGSEYQLTTVSDANIATFGTNTGYVANHTGGWTFLPGGLILQYGARSTPGTSGTITFPRSFPTAYFSIILTMSRNASSSTQSVTVDNAVGTSTSSFAYRSSSSNTDPIYWYAIGN